jgi:hypothetical protein
MNEEMNEEINDGLFTINARLCLLLPLKFSLFFLLLGRNH